MKILDQVEFGDYELLDTGEGERLERFGTYILRRPDPQIIWKKSVSFDHWNKADAVYKRTNEDKGFWQNIKNVPPEWEVKWNSLKFLAKLSSFKHTGIFPEQSAHWVWLRERITNGVKDKQPNVLNLFGYTGIASLVCAAAGAKVTHVDASKSTIVWARKNQELSGLAEKPIRWIEDDVLKYVAREVRRGNTYDGIIMDPPAFGHGPEGDIWKFNSSFPQLLELCKQVLSDQPLFVLVNAYAVSTSYITLQNVLQDLIGNKGTLEGGELVLKQSNSDRLLSTGIFARWNSQLKNSTTC